MKTRSVSMKLTACAALLAAAVLLPACGASDDTRRASVERASGAQAQSTPARSAPPAASPVADAHDGHAHGGAGSRVPAYVKSSAELKGLSPILPAQQFVGKTRLAYQAVAEIPQTIAQLPCYCHCDRGFGHKSLHSCFVDDHASHCAVCVDEALLAHRLQKESRLSPEKIREVIIARYSREQ